MKYIISESRILDLALNRLGNSFGDLYYDQSASELYPGHNFYSKDGKIIFDSFEDRVIYDNDSIQETINYFSMDRQQTKEVVARWLSKYYDLHPNKIYSGSFEHVQ